MKKIIFIAIGIFVSSLLFSNRISVALLQWMIFSVSGSIQIIASTAFSKVNRNFSSLSRIARSASNRSDMSLKSSTMPMISPEESQKGVAVTMHGTVVPSIRSLITSFSPETAIEFRMVSASSDFFIDSTNNSLVRLFFASVINIEESFNFFCDASFCFFADT